MKTKKKAQDPIRDVHKARLAVSHLGTAVLPEQEGKEKGLIFRANPLKVEKEFTF